MKGAAICLVGRQPERTLCVCGEKQLASLIVESETIEAVESLLVEDHRVVRSEHHLPPP